MRGRSELYDILVNELRMDAAKATEILDNAFALHDDETKKKTVTNFHEEDIHDGTYIVCPRCGEHIELEERQTPKMVHVETVKEWLYTNFFEYEDNSYFGGGYVKLESVFDTFEEMFECFNRTVEG